MPALSPLFTAREEAHFRDQARLARAWAEPVRPGVPAEKVVVGFRAKGRG